HTDRGSQYASGQFTGLIKQSMRRKGNCWDNTVAESFFNSLKVEWIYKYQYQTRSNAEFTVFKWIETWYNRKRLHAALGLKSIEEFETAMYNQKLAVQSLLSLSSFLLQVQLIFVWG